VARLPLAQRDTLGAHAQLIFDDIAASRGKVAKVFRAMLHSPPLAERVSRLGHYLRFDSKLPADLRELCILVVAAEVGCVYEWRYHEPLARSAGLDAATIDSLRRGHDGVLDPERRALAGYCRAVANRGPIDTQLFAAVRDLLGEAQLTDVTILAGYYAMLAGLIASFEIEPEASSDDDEE